MITPLFANLGKITLWSTKATKVYNNVDIPEIVEMRARYPYARPLCHITVPTKNGKATIHMYVHDNRKTISQLLFVKWDPSCQFWHYLSCHRCSKKVLGDDGELWCTKYMLRFEVEDHTGTTVFVVLDSEVQKLVCSYTHRHVKGKLDSSVFTILVVLFSIPPSY
ncbi:hypothetical protein MKW98_003947 [Papaver atlanticum]|uniref:Replication factor A C-terminal domain-containing protein n=1 Tax=Papaver atlanticum TaxID=357466 RepID=A0AAD4SMN4_9MAGN|nr:hypothetical protein MKW98_003947 [Papaver atlanticum]